MSALPTVAPLDPITSAAHNALVARMNALTDPGPTGCSLAAAQSIGTSPAVVNLGVLNFGDAALWTGGRYTAPHTGTYLVTYSVTFAVLDSGTRGAQIRVNGAASPQHAPSLVNHAPGQTTSVSGAAMFRLNAGQYVELFALSSVATNVLGDQSAGRITSMQVRRIG